MSCAYMGVCTRACARVCLRLTHDVEDVSGMG